MSETSLQPGTYAAADPGHAAAIDFATGAVLTYTDLDERSRRLAGLWRARGLRPADHVAVLLDNQIRYFEVAWAAQRAGLYLTPVNCHLGANEARYIVRDCGAKALVATARLGPLVAALTPASAGDAEGDDDGEGPSVRLLLDGGGAGTDGTDGTDGWEDYDTALDAASPIDPADELEGSWMFYSSGTTGRPKGIMPPWREVPFGTGGVLDGLVTGLYGFRRGITYLCPAPLYHAAPLGWSLSAQRIGGTVVVLDRFDPEATLQAIERHRVTHAQFVPTHFVRMLKLDPAIRERYDVSSLEMVVHAAAPCPPAVKDRMLDWFGPVVHEYYSASEGAGFCAIGPDEWRAHRGSVGRSLLGAIHIVGADGDELPVGEAGQVWFESPARFEYHGDPVKTAEAIDVERGWATIGDIGYVDGEGYLYLTDRVAHTVISGGVNIYPREIEDVLVVHPAVTDAAVIGVPDDEMGERLLAVVQAAPGSALAGDDGADLAEALRSYCRERLAGFKVPREVVFVDELPRLPTGKIRKSELRSRFGTWSGTAAAHADCP
jgi:acyl-CoA synthetase (AMP-forming)/AMP-acid ligase II